MKIQRIDHIVLTVKNIENTIDFYCSTLGMAVEEFGNGRKALKFGNQKINLHQAGSEFEPKAQAAVSGSADICFIARDDIHDVIKKLEEKGIKIIEGPVQRMGATGSITSIYFRDPDNNLIEVANYIKASSVKR